MSFLKSWMFNVAGAWGRCDPGESIVIAGFQRSGTTWLLELLRTLPGYKALNEPLLYDEPRYEYGFSNRTYIEPGDKAPRQREYLEKVLSGRLGLSTVWHFESDARPLQLIEHARNRRLVVKFCRLNRMLRWFAKQFEVRGLAFIIRHPCAVVASMLDHEDWSDPVPKDKTGMEAELVFSSLPDPVKNVFRPIIEDIDTKAEMLAVLWSIDHYIPLKYHSGNHLPWLLLPYERLVSQPKTELRRITEAMGLALTPEMHERLNKPSLSVTDPAQFHRDPDRQLTKWRRRLSAHQIENILEIVDRAGLSDIYSGVVEPDYDLLNTFQYPSGRW